MKAGIITYHFPYNSGAALQSLALQTVLSSMGHEVSILNYRPWYHQNICTPNKNVVYIMQESMEQEKADFRIFGHFHDAVDMAMPDGGRLIVLKDWIAGGEHFACFDAQTLEVR